MDITKLSGTYDIKYLTEQDIPDSAIHAALADTGYLPLGIAREEEKPRGLAALFRK